jgi:hypothetical protein
MYIRKGIFIFIYYLKQGHLFHLQILLYLHFLKQNENIIFNLHNKTNK